MSDDSDNQDVNAKPLQNQPKREWSVELAREIVEQLREPPPRRLPFETQCAIFAFAYSGMANRYLARAFQVSQATISNIAGCLDYDPDPYKRRWTEVVTETGGDVPRVEMVEEVTPRDHNGRRKPERKRHYENVAREFEALGVEEFTRRYMTKDNYNLVAIARREVLAERPRKTQLQRRIELDERRKRALERDWQK